MKLQQPHRTAQLQETIDGLSQGACLQRFVRPGGKHAVLFRCICKSGVEMRRFVLSAKTKVMDENVPCDDRFLCSVHAKEPPQATLLARKALPELTESIGRLREFLLLHGLPSDDLAVDFVRDHAGSIWLIQVKGFQVFDFRLGLSCFFFAAGCVWVRGLVARVRHVPKRERKKS